MCFEIETYTGDKVKKMFLLKWYKDISNFVINLLTCQESKSFVVVTNNVNDLRIGNRIVTKEGAW